MLALAPSRSSTARPARAEPTRERAAHRRAPAGWQRMATAVPVSRPGDASEREAERGAAALLRGERPGAIVHGPAAPVQRACAACEEEQPSRIDRSAAGATPAAAVPGALGAGMPLPAAARGYFEPLLGLSLAQVRVHDGPAAAEAASALNAHAFTHGNDIAFASGQYRPGTPQGRGLLAHELVHVAQQAQHGATALQRSAVEGPAAPVDEGQRPVSGRAPDPGGPTVPAGTTPAPENCPPPADMDCQPATDEPAAVRSTIAFAQDASLLGPRGIAEVDSAAAAWQAAGGVGDLRIDGYASAEGDCEYNWRLSCRRAQAVAHELAHPSDHGPGVPPARLQVLAHGESDSGAASLAGNRRATISAPPPAPVVPVPAPACAAPCTMPVLLGTGRTGCGSGTDFTHNDHPSISTSSDLKLRAWAAARPGGVPFRSSVSDTECELEMKGVLAATAGTAGVDAFTQFQGGSGSTVTHGPGSTLGALAMASSRFLATVATVRADVDAQLAAQAARGPLDPCALAVVPPATSWRLSLIGPLEAVIGGTHGEKLFADAFSCNPATRTYAIDLRFVICDNFGVDEHDLYAPGLFPFWVLQHERGSAHYAPFINELELPVTIAGTY